MQNYPFIHSADLSNPADNLELLCAHDHPAQEVEWLWHGKIPIGKVSMIIGDPGTGKTLLALDIAARASRGDNQWPDEPVKSQELRDKSQTSDSGSRLSSLDSKLSPSGSRLLTLD